MTELFQNKYRIPTVRLSTWDYSNEGFYFITICTKNREHYFGNISESNLKTSEIGEIAVKEWINTPIVRPDMNLVLGEFVVMPNHMHAILIIGKNDFNSLVSDRTLSKQKEFSAQSKNLASIIRGYKSAVTSFARKNNITFDWQARYHEHIIRSEEDFVKISNYIINNPANWEDDSLYK